MTRASSLDIYITEICNLNCEYCYVDLKKTETDGIEVRSFMERVNLLEYDTIKFYGGEPLIRWNEIRDIIEAVHLKNNDIFFTIITNGLLLSEEKLKFFLKHHVNIAISIHFPAMNRLFTKKNLNLFSRFRQQITFNLLFRYGIESMTTKVFLMLSEMGFQNFSLAPVSNDCWKNLSKLRQELERITKYITVHPSININESNWNQLKNLKREGFCTKDQVNHNGEIKACTRFDKLDFLDNNQNIKYIDTVFNTTNGCSGCHVRWFCTCNKGWYLDNFGGTLDYDSEMIKQFHYINELFILFYKEIANITHKWNYLSSGIHEIRLNLTEQCNLRCEYCYLKFSNAKMEASIGENVIDFFIEQEGDDKTISFFGGEPLLEFSLLKSLTLYASHKAKSHGKNIHFKIATNALLMTDEAIVFLQEHNFEIHISWNGNKELHDASRDESYDMLLGKIGKLQEMGYHKDKIVILFVIFPSTVHQLTHHIYHIFSLGVRIVYLEMYIGKKYQWDHVTYKSLATNLALLYQDIPIGNTLLNFTYQDQPKFLDISTRGLVSENSFAFFGHKDIDFKPKKYLDLLCTKIIQSYAK